MDSIANPFAQLFASERRGIPRLPSTVLEIQPEFVMAARLAGAKSSALRKIGKADLDADIVKPSATQPNISHTARLAAKLSALSKSIRGRRRLALLLPDGVVRVNVLAFETLPSKVQQRDDLLRWRIKDGLGFPPEQATLSYQITFSDPKTVEVLLIAAKTEILSQYVGAVDSIGAGAILILPATMALLPLLPEDEPGGQLLTHIHSGWVTNVIVTGGRLRFWRSRRLEHAGIESAISEALSEAARAAASVRDRMGVRITQAWYCARPGAGAADDLGVALARVASCPANPLPLGSSLGLSLGQEERPLFESFGAPLAGLIMNTGAIQ
jgi:hypothetical protein